MRFRRLLLAVACSAGLVSSAHAASRLIFSTAPRPAPFAARLIGTCDGRSRLPDQGRGGFTRNDPEPPDCAMQLGGTAGLRLIAGNTVHLQQDPTSFHFLEGSPVADRVWVPGLLIGRAGSPVSLGLGTTASPSMWGVVALTVRF